MKKKLSHLIVDFLWNLWCIISIIGIWPRFIEPRLIFTTRLRLKSPQLPKTTDDIHILQFSDLHFHKGIPQKFLDKIVRKIRSISPDIIVFSGDLLCYSDLKDKKRLINFLSSLTAPFGCFFVFGNHDYEKYVSITQDGTYDVIEKQNHSFIIEGFRKLLNPPKKSQGSSKRASSVGLHKELCSLLSDTPFEILENQTRKIPIKGSFLNICGLGDLWLERCKPEKAFANYDTKYPGIVLSHNPDSFRKLKNWPGDIVLCGHTHGGQVNLPFLKNKFIHIKHSGYLKGLIHSKKKKLYINRGIGSHKPFRWFTPPELLLLSLQGNK